MRITCVYYHAVHSVKQIAQCVFFLPLQHVHFGQFAHAHNPMLLHGSQIGDSQDTIYSLSEMVMVELDLYEQLPLFLRL